MSDSSPEPMVRLQPGGVAPIISYNVPEPTTYSGRNFIDLQFPASWFAVPAHPASLVAPSAIGTGSVAAPADKLVPQALGIEMPEVAAMEGAGKRLQVYRSMSGALAYTWVDAALDPDPLVEPGARAARLAPINGGGIPDPPETEVAITSPADGQTVTGPFTGAPVTISGTVVSNRTISNVSVRVGSGSFVAAKLSGGTWSLATTLTSAGQVPITARARTSTTLITDCSITVNVSLAPKPDTTPPAIAITGPQNGAALNSTAGPMTLTVTGTAGDASGVQLVDVAVDGQPYAAASSSDGWSTWSRQVSLMPGNHTIGARATDKAGNVSTASVSVSVALAAPPDTAPPTVTITSPSAGSAVQGPYSGATLNLTGTASDPSGIAEVRLQVDQNPVFTLAQPGGSGWGQWTGSITLPDPGQHLVTAIAIDKAGISGTTSVMVSVTLAPDIVNRLNRIILVESFRLSSFLGSYGAGRTLKTFSLLPGEKTRISMKSYTRTESDAKDASNILDSFTDESSTDFETSMAAEQSNKKNYDETWNYKVSAEASASWGWGSASVSGSMSGGTNSAREEFAKNITNAVQKHVSKASAKREVQVNTSYEVKTESGEETSIEREIANINVGATLNFVFRQMNQEFISLLHLVDVRVGYFKVDTINGVESYTYREVTVPELDTLIRDVVVAEHRAEVRSAVLAQLSSVYDYQDRKHAMVEEATFEGDSSSYLRVRKGMTSAYVDEATGTQISVPGVIMAASRNVLRTEGVIVEALLGHGDGLDTYSHGLQHEAVRAKQLDNVTAELEHAQARLALKIVKENDTETAELFRTVVLGQAPATPATAPAPPIPSQTANAMH